jgi:predicted transcriptional regulator
MSKVNVKNVKVKEIMSAPVKSMTLLMTIEEAIQFLIGHQISGAPLVDKDGVVVSVVSEMDLMKLGVLVGLKSLLGENLDQLPFSNKIISVKEDDSFHDMFKKFLTENIRRVLVLDKQGHPVGIVARRDVIRSFLDHHS